MPVPHRAFLLPGAVLLAGCDTPRATASAYPDRKAGLAPVQVDAWLAERLA